MTIQTRLLIAAACLLGIAAVMAWGVFVSWPMLLATHMDTPTQRSLVWREPVFLMMAADAASRQNAETELLGELQALRQHPPRRLVAPVRVDDRIPCAGCRGSGELVA